MVETKKIRLFVRTETVLAKERRLIRTAIVYRRRDFIGLALLRAWFFGSLSLLFSFAFITLAAIGKVPTIQQLVVFLRETGLLLCGIYIGCIIILMTFAWLGADTRYKKARECEKRYRNLATEMRIVSEQYQENDQESWQGLGKKEDREETDEPAAGAERKDQQDHI